jgi:hypothetical protein
MELEFEQVKRRRVNAPKSTYTTPTMSENEDSSDEAGSAPSADDVDSIYSENLSDSESEGASSSEYDSTDVDDTHDKQPCVAAEPDVHVPEDLVP